MPSGNDGTLNAVDFNRTYRVSDKFFYSAKGTYLQVINVAEDDNFIYRMSGPCRFVFEQLAKGQTLNEIRENLLLERKSKSPQEIDTFLISFVQDLDRLQIFQV